MHVTNSTADKARPRRSRVWRVVLVLTVAYVGYCALLTVIKDRMVFPIHHAAGQDNHAKPTDVREVVLEPEPGVRVPGWFLPAKRAGPGPAVLFFHGNADRKAWRLEMARFYQDLGFSVLLAEFRGYNGAGGKPTVETIPADARAWGDALARQPEVDPAAIVIHGYSLGCAFAAQAAAARPPKALILEAPFSSLAAMARRHGVLMYFPSERLDNEAIVRSYTGPVLVLHGVKDTVIPYAQGQAVAAAAGGRGRLVTMELLGHALEEDTERYQGSLREFLKPLLPPQ